MKQLIALYKAFRGGEWFTASLESILPHVDGVVVVLGESSWINAGDVSSNCKEPLEAFRATYPKLPVHVASSPPAAHSSDQYDIGLKLIHEAFGPDSAVLIVDTDEIWPEESLLVLKTAIDAHPDIQCFQGQLYSYVKSPLYQVWPSESGSPCVALQTPLQKEEMPPLLRHNRFASAPLSNMRIPKARFHHFTYIRNTDNDLRLKFATTSSQERFPSNSYWWESVWPFLPAGHNIHMTQGCEHCWQEIKVLTPRQLPAGVASMPLVQDAIAKEDFAWRKRLQTCPHEQALIPVPNDIDANKYYGDLCLLLCDGHHVDLAFLQTHLKTTYLEALWLAHWASQVPERGRILEIGSGSGASMGIFALASVYSVQLDAVDPFTPYDEEGTSGIVRDVMEGDPVIFWDMANTYQYTDRLTHFAIPSQESHSALSDFYDFIFVDGNHSREFVDNDLALAWSRLKRGGVLVGHDYTTRFPGVIASVDAWNVPVTTPAGTSLFIAHKPKD